jgi:hypothetical protein
VRQRNNICEKIKERNTLFCIALAHNGVAITYVDLLIQYGFQKIGFKVNLQLPPTTIGDSISTRTSSHYTAASRSNDAITFINMRLNQAVCYVCLHAVDEAGQLLRRDCACRGTDAGFVHLSCLTKYAEVKSTQARDTDEFVNVWETCPGVVFNTTRKGPDILTVPIVTVFVPIVTKYT